MLRADVQPRVLHVDDQHGWRGGERQMMMLACGLQRRGIPCAAVVQRGGLAARRLRKADLDVRNLRMRGEVDLPAARQIARMARAGGFNILHSHTAHAHTLVLLASHLCMARCKVVAHRRIEFAVGKRLLGLGKLKYLAGTDAHIAISNRVKDTLVEAGLPEWRVFPVHSAAELKRFADVPVVAGLRASLGIPDDAFVVGNIGALVGHKDHRNLLEACAVVRSEIPDLWVVIVGSGPLRQRTLADAEALDMADRLVMTGFRWDVPELIRMFDLFALSSSEEGMCSTLTQVATSGCPIVATDAGGVREVIVPEQTGVVVPISDARALAEGILRLAGNPQHAREMVRRGQERIRRYFNADVLTERTLEVYERVLRGRVGPKWPAGYCTD